MSHHVAINAIVNCGNKKTRRARRRAARHDAVPKGRAVRALPAVQHARGGRDLLLGAQRDGCLPFNVIELVAVIERPRGVRWLAAVGSSARRTCCSPSPIVKRSLRRALSQIRPFRVGMGTRFDGQAEAMTDFEIISEFRELYANLPGLKEWQRGKRPLLAHYTSITTLKDILKRQEVWLSNPLFMNDLEELRFGIIEGTALFAEKCGGACRLRRSPREDVARFQSLSRRYFKWQKHGNRYLCCLCLSEHPKKNNDGSLSMRRAYGRHGNGAALVFRTEGLMVTP